MVIFITTLWGGYYYPILQMKKQKHKQVLGLSSGWDLNQAMWFQSDHFDNVALVVKNPLVSAEDVIDVVLIPGSGRAPGGGHGNPLQYSFLENPMHRGAWRTIGACKELDMIEATYHTIHLVCVCVWCTHTDLKINMGSDDEYIFIVCFLFFFFLAYGILDPQPRIQHTPPATKAES